MDAGASAGDRSVDPDSEARACRRCGGLEFRGCKPLITGTPSDSTAAAAFPTWCRPVFLLEGGMFHSGSWGTLGGNGQLTTVIDW